MSRRALLIAPLLVLALAGCVPTTPSASNTPTASDEPTSPAVPVPTATATATPTASPETEPVTLGCDDVIGAQAIYDYNPNVGMTGEFAADPDSLAGEAVAQQGLACRLVNQTSGATIDIGVVKFVPAAFDAKQAAVSGSSTPASTFDGYFDSGVAQGFASPYWVTVVANPDFIEDADAARIVGPILDNLG